VLPHFLLYLRYIHSDFQIQKLQACLNRSLCSTLHVYGHATALLAEVGIPPLHITQNLQLAQFRYRLSTNQNNIIPHTLYVREQQARAIMHDDTMGRRMHQAICQVDRDRIDPHTPMPPSVQQAKPQNREKSYRKILEKLCSKQWMQHLQSKLLGPPGRLRAYVHWHVNSDTLGRNLYRPAPYLTHHNAKYQLEMLRVRTTLHTFPPALSTRSSRPGTLPRQVVPTVPTCRWTRTRRRKAHNQQMPSVTGRAPRPQVLQQMPRSDAPD